MKVLVTGGAGFIGSHLVRRLAKECQVVVLDDLSTGTLANLEGVDCEFVEGSIDEEEALDRCCRGVDRVFHLAAMISVPLSMEQPLECVRLNATGTLKVLQAAANQGVRKLVLASSAAIYGDDPEVPKREDMTPDPRSPYAVTKLDGEYYCDLFRRERKLETACLRFFNVFGPRQNPRSAYAAAVPIFITRALAGEPLQIHGDGGQTRDFVHVVDIAAALDFVSLHTEAAGVFNCGYGSAISIRSLAERIIHQCGSSSVIEHTPPRTGDVRHSLASVEKLRGTGWSPVSSLEAGLTETIAAFRAARGGF
jgi:UDP-glucose 4-epimerase